MIDFSKIHKVYFLGIGGIGMSAIARYLNANGVEIYGYDRENSLLTEQMISEGMKIHFEENIEKIPHEIDLVVYTPAIDRSNKEFQFFSNKGLIIKKRSEILSEITNDEFLIAIAGTHGKTSISSIISHIFNTAAIACTSFIGGISKNIDSNLQYSENSKVFIAEADEFDRSFLSLNPNIAVISSIDADHLDIYGNYDNLLKSFTLFADKIKHGGKLIIKSGLNLPTAFTGKKITYSFDSEADYHTSNYNFSGEKSRFDLIKNEKKLDEFMFSIPGIHNIENAIAAIAVALEFGINLASIKSALESYSGVKRRFDYRINTDKLVYIDDYAHHPNELKAIISAVRQLYPKKKICGIFQPHLFSRTKDFLDEFVKSLELLDEIILLEIYPAREKPIDGINSKLIFDRIQTENKKLLKNHELYSELENNKKEVVLSLGAGDIYKITDQIEFILRKQML
ncbi:MAG: UDP-N-acetylmuramate--L-alanine ligase [Bacteroidales bacterium]|nr:UDP-N-acetylmuramate--L-alanine ligase [Bacteroidales bacterium]